MTNLLLSFFGVLFVMGFAYGALLGNANMHPLKRGVYGGLFFALFFIAIPAVVIENRKAAK